MPATPASVSRSRFERDPFGEDNAVGGGLRRETREHPAALDPAGARAEVAVPISGLRPSGEPAIQIAGPDPLGRVAAASQQREALVLEPARPHLLGREQQEAVLMIERRSPRLVPAIPPGKRGLAHRGVELVGAVVHAHDLADVGRRRHGSRHGTGIHDGDVPSALAELQCGGDAEYAGADDDDRPSVLHGSIRARKRSTSLPAADTIVETVAVFVGSLSDTATNVTFAGAVAPRVTCTGTAIDSPAFTATSAF